MTLHGEVDRGLVVELCLDDVAGSYCARMLRSVGFRVVKVETEAGDPLRSAPPLLDGGRSALFEYLNVNKESAVADVDTAEGWAFMEGLIQRADIAVMAVNGDADRVDALQRRVAAANRGCVRVVTSGYGLTGPYRDLIRTDLMDWAASGYMYVTGDPAREPLSGGGPFPAYTTGLTATVGALAAWREAQAGAPGRLVDISAMESMGAIHQWTFSQYSYTGWIKQRVGDRHGEMHHPVAFLECADGWICVAAAGAVQWERLAEVVDQPELVTDERFRTAGERFDHADEVDGALRPWLMGHTSAEAARILAEHRVPAAVVSEVRDVLRDAQLRGRQYFRTVDIDGRQLEMPGAPFAFGPPLYWQAAPALGRDSAKIQQANIQPASTVAGPPGPHPPPSTPTVMLEGVRVLDLTRVWSGPLAGRLLADLGADVIHVEYSTARSAGVIGTKGYQLEGGSDWAWGDLPAADVRAGVFPDADPGPDPWNRQASFNKLNRNKRSISVNLQETEGLEILQGLVAVSDVVLENYSPRGARGLGVVFDLLREINPRLVFVSISGYGHSGPDHDRVALGPIMEAESGLAALTGYRGGGPAKLGIAMPDAISGLNGAIAVLAALAERDRSGTGSYVDISMLETFAAIGGEAFLVAAQQGATPPRHGNRSARWAVQGAYRCAGDDEWIAISIRTTEEWRRLVDLVGAPPLRDVRFRDEAVRRREQPYIDRVLSSWAAARSKWEAFRLLAHQRLAAMPVMTNADLIHDEQLVDRGFIVEWDQPGIGLRQYPGVPIHFDPPFVHGLAPAAGLGRDNREVLRDLLHYDETKIDELHRRGVLSTRPPH